MTVKLLISSMIFLCIFSQSVAQVSENIERQDAETFVQQDTLTVLTVGETIFIDVTSVPSLTGEYTIDQSGNVDLPLIGKVKALEQPPASFARTLEVLYEKNYLQNPRISVELIGSSAPSRPIEKSFAPDIAQQINNVSNNSISNNTLEDLTLEPMVSPDLSASDIDTLPAKTPVNNLTSGLDIQSIAEPSLPRVDIKTDPQPIIIETSSSLEGTNWSLGSDPRKAIHFLSEGEMAGTIGCNNFLLPIKNDHLILIFGYWAQHF